MSKLIPFILGTLLLVSCSEHTELEQPMVNNDGETVAVTKEIQISVLPMQRVGGGSTRSASDKPEADEAITVTYRDAATTRAQDGIVDMTAAESKINNAYIVQFNGTSPTSTAAWVSGDVKSQLSSGAAITCNFVMTAGVLNRVYVIANRKTVPTKGMTLEDFEALVTLAVSTSVPATGLPMSAMQDVTAEVGAHFDVFQLKSLLAKLTFTCPTAGAILKLKGLPTGYSFNTQAQPSSEPFRPANMTYNSSGSSLISGTTYYVPENLSGRNELLIMPNMRALGMAPANSMYVSITNGGTVYNILLGDGSASDFNFAGGYSYSMNILLYGSDSSDLRVGNPMPSAPIDLNATGETANCYVVGTNTWYLFNSTVMGNGATTPLPANINAAKSVASAITPTKLNPVRADVLWETVNTATAPAIGAVVVRTYLLKDRILFQSGNVLGNAVIAVRDGGNRILWSWHIWRTSTPAGIALKTITDGAAFTAPALKLMDRNLGALEATTGATVASFGFSYQWGRKDPFPGAGTLSTGASFAATTNIANWNEEGVTMKKSAASLSEAVSNPTVFYAVLYDWASRNDNLWGTPLTSSVVINNGVNNTFNSNGGSKSIYDPCPVGWRVPPHYTYANAVVPAPAFAKGYDFAGSLTNSGTSLFLTAAGLRDVSYGVLTNSPSYGYYWSSSPHGSYPERGGFLHFVNTGTVNPQNYNHRAYGFSVRCVQN